MELIISIIKVISDNRFWLMPLVLVVALWMLAVEVGAVFKGILQEMD